MTRASKQATRKPLKMSFAGGLIKHLGLQMYSGPVPSIAELVANAWDAMATKVDITIPTGQALKASDIVVVEDDGLGMTYEECRDKYLVVGRERRVEEGDMSERRTGVPQRRVISRKGIGKLAGFGIATLVEVRTVKNGIITHFAMDFVKMTEGKKYIDEYEPDFLSDDGKETKEKSGTRITLKRLKVSKTVNAEDFARSMARRFCILSDPHFSVAINKKKITKTEVPFQFRFPEKSGSWTAETIPDVGEIKWWVGFTEKPIGDDEARGIVVFARGKLVQAPWFFDISGGTYGQHGMQYMTGEVVADFLDLTDGEDLIATDRASVMWDEHPSASALKQWGDAKVRALLREWADKRTKEKRERPEVQKYLNYGEKLPPREKRIFTEYIHKITSIPQLDEDDKILDELARFGYNALTNSHFLDMIKQINAASPTDTAKIGEILEEWDIIEAISVAQQVKGRVEIIRKFEEMIDAGVPEKPDMQDYIMEHPWLIDPIWAPLKHEKSLDTLLEKQFHRTRTGKQSGRERVDYFCFAGPNQWEVVELKRPGKKVGLKELEQIQRYVMFLREQTKKDTLDGVSVDADHVRGILIYSDIDAGQGTMIDTLRNAGILVLTWRSVLKRTKDLHQDFLKTTIDRAPANDPRIEALEEVGTDKKSLKKTAKKVKTKKKTTPPKKRKR